MSGPVLTPMQQRAGQGPVKQNQPDWFDANGASIPAPASTSPQTQTAQDAGGQDWFADNAPSATVQMIGPDGSQVNVDRQKVSALRQQNFSVSPNNPEVT